MSSPTEIYVHSPLRHPRLRYVLSLVGDDLGYRFRFYHEASVFGPREHPFGISYAAAGPHALPHHPLLAGGAPTPHDLAPAPGGPAGVPCFFATPTGPDLLACIFFAVSRYEEYEAQDVADAHGRFPATASHAAAHGYLDRPVVREWTAAIGRQLRAWFPALPAPRHRPLALRPTYDIDLLWAWHHRGWRGRAAAARDLLCGQWARCLARVRSSPTADPYYTVDQLEALHHTLGLTATYFWLLSDRSDRVDPNPYPIPEAQRALMRRLGERALTGLHPSYYSSRREGVLQAEVERFRSIYGSDAPRSRQHYLRFRLPDTYRMLLAAGLREDHTMGYADAIGWRAGTNLPFAWYDLDREQTTRLIVHPFAAMDATLRHYLDLGAAGAGAEVIRLAGLVRAFGGPFTLLWHNSSFSSLYGWEGWYDAYVTLLRQLLDGDAAPWTPGRGGQSR